MLLEILTLGSGLLVFLWLFDKLSRPKNFPPGPFLFPYFGALPQLMTGDFNETLQKWKNEYGNIFSFKMGTWRIVVLNDYNIIKDALNKREFTGKPLTREARQVAGEERRGLTRSQGSEWEGRRRFTLRRMRDFGLGKSTLEATTLEGMVDLIAKFRENLGQPVTLPFTINSTVTNALCQIVFGRTYDIDDPELLLIFQHLRSGVSAIFGNAKMFSMEWLITLAPNWTKWTHFTESIDAVNAFVNVNIDHHRRTFQEGNLRDFTDAYINKINHSEDRNSAFNKTAGVENLKTLLVGLFSASSPSGATLRWAVYLLSRNPEIQKQFQTEIDCVVGRSRLPSLSDKHNMPFVEATTMEVLRMSALFPLNLPHSTMTDVNFHGFAIPKNTVIYANFHDVHHNKAIWGDPEVFRPQRFLTPDGKAIAKNHPPIIPFSIGKRQCIGEALARHNIFLFLVTLFQAFEVKSALTSSEKVKLKGDFFRVPPDFKVIFEDRC